MTVSEEDKNYYSELLEDICHECHDCKHLYLDYEYYENLDDEFPCFECFKDQLVHIDEDNPRPPCKYKEEATKEMNEHYQNWIWHTLYFLERRNAPKGKITGMVTREKLIQFIQELEKESWEKATTLEKQDGDIEPPLTRVQIANHIRGLKGRKLIKEYKNSKDETCLRTI